MAVTGYPFERQDTTETQYANLFSELQDPGVIGSALGAAELRATLPGGLVVRIAAGRAYARGFILDNDSDFDVNVGPADTQTRIDRVVARVNPVTDTATLEHLRGAPGAGVPRPLVRTFTGAYDVPLYQFTVAGGAVAPTDLVDERQWTSHRVRMWRTSDRELVAPRLGQVGFNLVTGRYEGWAGEWVTLRDSRDDAPGTRTWRQERDGSGMTPFGGDGSEVELVAVTLPSSAPSGLYLVSGTVALQTLAGQTGNAGTLRIRTDGYVRDAPAHAESIARTYFPVFPYTHSGGARSIGLSVQPSAPGVQVLNDGTAVEVTYVGGR